MKPSIKPYSITVGGIKVSILRKEIKNLHLGVYPPDGRVRVAAPLKMSKEAIRLAVVTRLGWIKRQQAAFAKQPRESKREMVRGESHYLLGRRYRLRIVPAMGAAKVVLRSTTAMELHVPESSTPEQRERVLQRFYRQQLKELIPPLLEKWQPRLGVTAAEWGIKRMKTKWGTCNPLARRVWLNLELAKKPVQCVEYILVHELTHLLEATHNDRFVGLMNRFIPKWQHYREILNRLPVSHAEWGY
jgi:predicted metal-dependent hydrolase